MLAIDHLQAKLDRVEQARAEPIAIVGMGCRLPGGASSPDALWSLVRDGREAIREVPAGRFGGREVFAADASAPGTTYLRAGGFLEQVDGFDAAFFRISPHEAARMDPQQRLFLEVAWEALEHAGIAPDRLYGSQTGVFAGVHATDYAHVGAGHADRVDAYYSPGVDGSYVAGRLSYCLGLHGPSLAVDTAC